VLFLKPLARAEHFQPRAVDQHMQRSGGQLARAC
jgi:hypothetical protein